MISAVHTKPDLDFALERFEKIGRKLGSDITKRWSDGL